MKANEVDDFSGSWTGLRMIGGCLVGIDHGSGSGEECKREPYVLDCGGWRLRGNDVGGRVS